MDERKIGELIGENKALKKENNHLKDTNVLLLRENFLQESNRANNRMKAVELALKHHSDRDFRGGMPYSPEEVFKTADKIFDYVYEEDEEGD